MLQNLEDFQKEGYWLAVVTKHRRIKIVAAAKDPKRALQDAHNMGYKQASLMKSAKHYGVWVAQAQHEA
ncbi:hypothetical protein C4579_03935 [Candidatus Microgenomates bacterium]|nr:MAG: hypothetical protein C4579_03935 [Candidatus Microgenomates bacterium]